MFEQNKHSSEKMENERKVKRRKQKVLRCYMQNKIYILVKKGGAKDETKENSKMLNVEQNKHFYDKMESMKEDTEDEK